MRGGRPPRAVLTLALVACASAGPSGPAAGAQSTPARATAAQDTGVWAYERVGDGVYASVTRPERGYANFANSLIVVGEAGVAVVDSRESPAAARELIAYVRTLTGLPVLAVVNTHWHWDHVNGNQAFVDAFPGVAILGHPETRRLMEAEGAARVDERITGLSDRRDRLTRWIDAGATDDGRELTADELRQAQEIVRSDGAKIAAFEEVVVTVPTRLVTDSAVIDLGGRVVRLLHPGAAHTPGDLVVVVPDEGIAFLGDLIEYGPPYFGDGTVRGSARALDRLDELGTERYLPGHGPMRVGRSLFDAQRAFLADLVAAADGLATGSGDASDGAGSDDAASDAAGADDVRVRAAARRLASEHAAALPGFESTEDERLVEYVAETLRAALAER